MVYVSTSPSASVACTIPILEPREKIKVTRRVASLSTEFTWRALFQNFKIVSNTGKNWWCVCTTENALKRCNIYFSRNLTLSIAYNKEEKQQGGYCDFLHAADLFLLAKLKGGAEHVIHRSALHQQTTSPTLLYLLACACA